MNKYYSAINSKGDRIIGHSPSINKNGKTTMILFDGKRKVVKSYRSPSKKELKNHFRANGCELLGYERYLMQMSRDEMVIKNQTPYFKKQHI